MRAAPASSIDRSCSRSNLFYFLCAASSVYVADHLQSYCVHAALLSARKPARCNQTRERIEGSLTGTLSVFLPLSCFSPSSPLLCFTASM